MLELDGYNKKYKIAFEYNGEQHYIFPSYWIKDKKKFETQLKNDKTKIERCKNLNIHLIIIKYNERNIKEYIENELDKLNEKYNIY